MVPLFVDHLSADGYSDSFSSALKDVSQMNRLRFGFSLSHFMHHYWTRDSIVRCCMLPALCCRELLMSAAYTICQVIGRVLRCCQAWAAISTHVVHGSARCLSCWWTPVSSRLTPAAWSRGCQWSTTLWRMTAQHSKSCLVSRLTAQSVCSATRLPLMLTVRNCMIWWHGCRQWAAGNHWETQEWTCSVFDCDSQWKQIYKYLAMLQIMILLTLTLWQLFHLYLSSL